MAVLANSFDGGTPGVALTAANSGGASGDAFDVVDPSSSPILYTADALHGTGAVEFDAADDDPIIEWTSGVSAVTTYGRVYLKIPSLPPDDINVVRHLAGSQTVITVRIGSSGRIGLLYATGTFAGNGTHTIPLNTWVRLEWAVTTGIGTGSVQADLYLTPESETPDDTVSATNVDTATAAAVTVQRMGMISSETWGFVLDSVAFSDEAPIGPVGGGTPPANDATLAATLPPLAAAAEGTVTSPTTGGTLAATLPALAADGTATVRNPATAAAQLPALGATASAPVRDDATMAATLPALTSSAAATATNPTTPAATLPALGAAAAAGIRDGAAVASSLPALQARFGTGTPPNLAQLAATLPALRTAAATATTNAATLGADLPALTVAVHTTTPDAPGMLAATLPALTAAAAVRLVDGGDLGAALPALTASAATTARLGAAAAVTLPALAAAFTDQPTTLPDLDGTIAPAGRTAGALDTGRLAGSLTPSGRLAGALH